MPLGAHKAALFGVAGVSTDTVVLLSTQTASNSASISFTSDITSTYGEYIFKFYNINPATDGAHFSFQVNATDDAGGDYDTSLITSTHFRVYHSEGDSVSGPEYQTGYDLAQSASFQMLAQDLENDADSSCAGILHLFNPASTTYVKHFYSRFSSVMIAGPSSENEVYQAGYINDTTAIDDIQFKMNSGNFDGKIKMWGVK